MAVAVRLRREARLSSHRRRGATIRHWQSRRSRAPKPAVGHHEAAFASTRIKHMESASENTVVNDDAAAGIPFEVEAGGSLKIAGFLNGFVTTDSNVFVAAGLENAEDADPEPLVGERCVHLRRPHHSAMNRVIACVVRRMDSISTRSSKPWMNSARAP